MFIFATCSKQCCARDENVSRCRLFWRRPIACVLRVPAKLPCPLVAPAIPPTSPPSPHSAIALALLFAQLKKNEAGPARHRPDGHRHRRVRRLVLRGRKRGAYQLGSAMLEAVAGMSRSCSAVQRHHGGTGIPRVPDALGMLPTWWGMREAKSQAGAGRVAQIIFLSLPHWVSSGSRSVCRNLQFRGRRSTRGASMMHLQLAYFEGKGGNVAPQTVHNSESRSSSRPP